MRFTEAFFSFVPLIFFRNLKSLWFLLDLMIIWSICSVIIDSIITDFLSVTSDMAIILKWNTLWALYEYIYYLWVCLNGSVNTWIMGNTQVKPRKVTCFWVGVNEVVFVGCSARDVDVFTTDESVIIVYLCHYRSCVYFSCSFSCAGRQTCTAWCENKHKSHKCQCKMTFAWTDSALRTSWRDEMRTKTHHWTYKKWPGVFCMF